MSCTLGDARVPTTQVGVPPSQSTLTGAKLPRAKQSCVHACRVAPFMSNSCNPVDCSLPGFSVRGVSQERILEYIGQYWLPYPSRALYFLLP